MNIPFNQLATTLASKVHPILVLSGDEAELLREAYQLALASLATKDFSLDQKFVISASSDWQAMSQSMASGSLFAEKRVFVFSLESGSFSADLSHFVDYFLQHHAGQHVLLICMAKIAKKDQSKKCYKAIDRAGLIVQLWPLRAHEWRGWMQNHCRTMGLSYEPSVLDLIESATEGDLSAAKQSLEKLRLIFGTTHITAAGAQTHLLTQSKYQVYELMGHCLAGRIETVYKVFNHYRKKNNELNLLLWFVVRDLQLLHQLLGCRSRDEVYKKNNIWPARKQPYEMALRRVDKTLLLQWMAYAADLDRCIKSESQWLVWDALLTLLICITQCKPLFLEKL